MARKKGIQPVPWPSWRYGPYGESQIFKSESEVPEGWTKKPQTQDEPILSEVVYLDRSQIIADLLDKGIVADPRWPASRLKELLDKTA